MTSWRMIGLDVIESLTIDEYNIVCMVKDAWKLSSMCLTVNLCLLALRTLELNLI